MSMLPFGSDLLVIASTSGTIIGFGVGYYLEKHFEKVMNLLAAAAVIVGAIGISIVMVGDAVIPQQISPVITWIQPKVPLLVIILFFASLAAYVGIRRAKSVKERNGASRKN